jgi:hypothetical protein
VLFVVLFYVYPLKFVWTLVVGQFQRDSAVSITPEQGPMMMVIYGAGVIAVFATLALLYTHAYRRRAFLELTPIAVTGARIEMLRNAGIAAIGTLSVLLALLGMVRASGLVYFGIGLSEWTLGEYRGRLRKRAAAVSTTGISPASAATPLRRRPTTRQSPPDRRRCGRAAAPPSIRTDRRHPPA